MSSELRFCEKRPEPLYWCLKHGYISKEQAECFTFVYLDCGEFYNMTPLGALSIIVSVVLANFLLNEKLKKMGMLGCLLCIVDSTIIVLHAPGERELDSVDEIWELAIQPGLMTTLIKRIKCNECVASMSGIGEMVAVKEEHQMEGLDSEERPESLYWCLKHGYISKEQADTFSFADLDCGEYCSGLMITPILRIPWNERLASMGGFGDRVEGVGNRKLADVLKDVKEGVETWIVEVGEGKTVTLTEDMFEGGPFRHVGYPNASD